MPNDFNCGCPAAVSQKMWYGGSSFYRATKENPAQFQRELLKMVNELLFGVLFGFARKN